MHRRGFLGALGAATVGTSMGAGAAPAQDWAIRIGHEVLRQGALPRDAARLRRDLGFGTTAVATALTAPRRSTISADFANGRTVMAAGWTLALTEARLCALAALESAHA